MLNKNTKTITNNINQNLRRAEMVLVAGLVLATSLHFPIQNHSQVDKKSSSRDAGNAERREREETGPHYSSYGSMQRTPARSGTF